MIDFEHLLKLTLAAKSRGAREWRDCSRRERAFIALALNRAEWLREDELTMGQALDLIGADLHGLVPAVERAIAQ